MLNQTVTHSYGERGARSDIRVGFSQSRSQSDSCKLVLEGWVVGLESQSPVGQIQDVVSCNYYALIIVDLILFRSASVRNPRGTILDEEELFWNRESIRVRQPFNRDLQVFCLKTLKLGDLAAIQNFDFKHIRELLILVIAFSSRGFSGQNNELVLAFWS